MRQDLEGNTGGGTEGNTPGWTPEARVRLEQVPEGVSRELTRQRVEELARRRGQSRVTVELMEEKYHQWAEGSSPAAREMPWADEARQRIERVPAFVRGMVVKAIEAYAHSRGVGEITGELVDEAKVYWEKSGQFHRP